MCERVHVFHEGFLFCLFILKQGFCLLSPDLPLTVGGGERKCCGFLQL